MSVSTYERLNRPTHPVMLHDRHYHWWIADTYRGPFYCPICGSRGSTPDWNPRWGAYFGHDPQEPVDHVDNHGDADHGDHRDQEDAA